MFGERLYCPECGAENPDAGEICGLCHHPLDVASPPADKDGIVAIARGQAEDIWREEAATQDLPGDAASADQPGRIAPREGPPDYDAVIAAILAGKKVVGPGGEGLYPGADGTSGVPVPAAGGGGGYSFPPYWDTPGGSYSGAGHPGTVAGPGGPPGPYPPGPVGPPPSGGSPRSRLIGTLIAVFVLVGVSVAVFAFTNIARLDVSKTDSRYQLDSYDELAHNLQQQQAGDYPQSRRQYGSTTGTTREVENPGISKWSPSSGKRGTTISMTVSGSNLRQGLVISLEGPSGTRIPGTSVVIYGDDTLYCRFALGDKPGEYNLRITNYDGGSAVASGALRVD